MYMHLPSINLALGKFREDPPLYYCEIGVNHEGSMEKVKLLID